MEIRILAPTGAIGAGFRPESLERGVALRPHVIACDAGSTDSGPAYLGGGEPKLSREAVTRDLRHLLKARDALDVPLIVGSCDTSGCDGGADLGVERRSRCRWERRSRALCVPTGFGGMPLGSRYSSAAAPCRWRACDGPPGDFLAEALMEAFGGLGGVYRHSLRHVYLASFLAVLGCFFSILILIAMRLQGQDGESAPGAE